MPQAHDAYETLKRIRGLLPSALDAMWLEYAVAQYIETLAVRLQDAATAEHVQKMREEWGLIL
jgi:hypothetical protein